MSTNTLSLSYPMLAGNVAALLSPMVFVPVLTYTFGPQNYDYVSMREIRQVDDTDVAAAQLDPEQTQAEPYKTETKPPTSNDPKPTTTTQLPPPPPPTATNPTTTTNEELETKQLNKAALYSRCLCIFMVLSFLILWPIPMYGTSYVFSKDFFTGWAVVGMLWLFCSAFGVIVYPLYEGRGSIIRIVRLMGKDLLGVFGRSAGRGTPGVPVDYAVGQKDGDADGTTEGIGEK